MFFGNEKRKKELRASIEPILTQAEVSAGAHKHADAAAEYAKAWDLIASTKAGIKTAGEDYAFWILMNCVNSEWLSGDCDSALEAVSVAHRNLRGKSFGPVGNPFFHLRVGQCLWSLAEVSGEDSVTAGLDDLARALICGGIEMYNGEQSQFLDAVTAVLDPPEGFETWEASRGKYVGACRDLLVGASSQVRITLTEKFGRPPSYGAL
jgi:hypothetical protein